MSFIVKDERVLVQYSEIWNKIIYDEPIYDDKYIKTKVKIFNGAVHTNFHDKNIPIENTHYVYLAVIIVDSIMRMDKKNYPQVYLEECKYAAKERKITRFIDVELELDGSDNSDSE